MNKSLTGYLMSTLSSFNISDLQPIYYNLTELDEMIAAGDEVCYYQGKRHPPDHETRPLQGTREYWQELAMKLLFVFVFEKSIKTVTWLLQWLIPDIPHSLQKHIRRHASQTEQIITQLQRANNIA